MRTVAVVGANGFVGRNFVAVLEAAGLDVWPITRQSVPTEIPAVDCVFFCAGNSSPRLSHSDPIACLHQNVIELHAYLSVLRYQRFLYLSSASVYPETSTEKREDAAIDHRQITLYGAHKLLAERYVQQIAQRWVILRPSSLFGPHLKKNIFYDLRRDQQDIYLTENSALRTLDVRLLAQAARVLAVEENQIFNIASQHVVTVQELLAMKPGTRQIRGERHMDERDLALQKLHERWRESHSRDEYLAAIRSYLRGSARVE
jgi:nucleoside-diphosphate-sugar epimerase